MNYLSKAVNSKATQKSKKSISRISECVQGKDFVQALIVTETDLDIQQMLDKDVQNWIELNMIYHVIDLLTQPNSTSDPTLWLSDLLTTLQNHSKQKQLILSDQTKNALARLLTKEISLLNILNFLTRPYNLGAEPYSEIIEVASLSEKDLESFRKDERSKFKEIADRISPMSFSFAGKTITELSQQVQSLKEQLELIQKEQKTIMILLKDYGYQEPPIHAHSCLAHVKNVLEGYKGQASSLKSVNEKLILDNKRLQEQANQLRSANLKVNQEKKLHKDQILKKQNQIVGLQSRINQADTYIDSLKDELKLQQTTSQQATKKLKQVDLQKSKLQKKMVEQQSKNAKFVKEKEAANLKLIKIRQDLQSLKTQLKQLQAECDRFKAGEIQNQQAIKELRQLEARYHEQMQRAKDYVSMEQTLLYERLFSHQILADQPQDNAFIASVLRDRYNCDIHSSKLLCKLDSFAKVNFHKYIDKIPCILFIAKVDNDNIVAGFSQAPMTKGYEPQDAIIISVTNRQAFYPKSGTKTVTYDEFFFIIGNSELRMRSSEMKLFSNFAINNSFFDSRGYSVDTLFGYGKDKREVPLLSYEIFQVFFKGKPYVYGK